MEEVEGCKLDYIPFSRNKPEANENKQANKLQQVYDTVSYLAVESENCIYCLL